MKSADNSGIYFETGSRKTGTIDGTSNGRSGERFSVFRDEACGEPLTAQRLSIDFTPNDEIDNDFVQKKVCSFWKFIEDTPVIHNLMVKPEKVSSIHPSSASSTAINQSESITSVTEVEVTPKKPAVDMLEVVEKKRLIGRTLEAKMQQSYCSLGSREYKIPEAFKPKKKREKQKRVSQSPKVGLPSCSDLDKSGKTSSDQSLPLKMLNTTLTEWDAKHPKSMEVPSHPPILQTCILQRQVYQ